MVFSLSQSTFARPYYAKMKERKKNEVQGRGKRKEGIVVPSIKPCLKKDNPKKDRTEGQGQGLQLVTNPYHTRVEKERRGREKKTYKKTQGGKGYGTYYMREERKQDARHERERINVMAYV